MNRRIYMLLITLTTVVVVAALVKGVGLPLLSATFPKGQAAQITEIKEEDWTNLTTGEGVFFTIPAENSEAQLLEITSSWTSFEVYLENELLYSFNDEYNELGRASHWINIPDASNGKRIILMTSGGLSGIKKVIKNGSYLGTADAVRHHFFMRNLPTILLAVVDAIMVGVALLLLVVLRHKLSGGIICGIWDLALFIALNCIWIITDSGFLQCCTAKTGLWALVSYISFMVMPVFMLGFTQKFLTRRRIFLRYLAMAGLGLTVVTLVLYITKIAPLSTLLPLHQIMMFLDVVMCFAFCNYELKHYHIKRMAPICNGIILMGIFMILMFVAYWRGVNILYPLFYSAGFTCYIVSLTISVVKQAYDSFGKKLEMDAYKKLAYMDVMTMVYNRAAFMEYQDKSGVGVRQAAYVMFDINGLKSVNDTMGHQAGDDLIMRAAACIRETFEEAGKCYRIGGDEFMVVLENVHGKKEIMELLENFEKQVSHSNEHLAEDHASLSVAYGYSLAGGTPRQGGDMYEEADKEMYIKKRIMKEAV